MHKAYRFCFFEADEDPRRPQAAAVLVLHFDSDAAAASEAVSLLSVSALWRIEVWQGTRRICQRRQPVQSPVYVTSARAI
jgi:hypothetical protein